LFVKEVNQKQQVIKQDCEEISQGTHICIGLTAANGDLKLNDQNDQKGAFYTFCIQAGLLWIVVVILCKLVLL